MNGGRNQDSSAAANQYLNQIPGVAEKNLSPYIMPGEQSQSFIDKIMRGYKPSEGYNFQKAELGRELSNNAAAGGYAGGEYDQGQRGALIQSLLSGDMQQYLQNVLNAHNQSYQASSQLNDVQGNALNQQGGLAFGAAEGNNQRNASLRDALIALSGQAIGAFSGMPMGGGKPQGNAMQSQPMNMPQYGRGPVQPPGRTNTFGSAFGGGY